MLNFFDLYEEPTEKTMSSDGGQFQLLDETEEIKEPSNFENLESNYKDLENKYNDILKTLEKYEKLLDK